MQLRIAILHYLLNSPPSLRLAKARNRLTQVVFLLLLSLPLSAQDSIYIQAAQLPANDIIHLLEDKLQITFNYSHDYLPEGQFSFSCQGSPETILRSTFALLNRQYAQLDKNIYTIKNIAFAVDQRPAPTLLKGQLLDRKDHSPLIGATIWLPALKKAVLSNAQGLFSLEGYFADNEQIEFRYLGYKTVQHPISVFRSNPDSLSLFTMDAQSHILGQVEVTDYLPWKKTLNNGQEEVLRPEKMKPIAGQSDNDVLAIAQLLPGMYNATESVADLQTRGGPPDQTDLSWNGIPIFQTSHFFGKISAINPFMVDQMQVVRNGGSAAQSGQASGSLSLHNQAAVEDSLRLRLQSNLLYTNLGLRLPLWIKDKDYHLHFAWRQSHTQFLNNIVYKHFYDQIFQYGKIDDEQFYDEFYSLEQDFIPHIQFRDISASLLIPIDQAQSLKVSAIQLDNQMNYSKTGKYLDSAPADELLFNNKGLSLAYTNNYHQSNRHKTELKWSISNFDNHYQFLSDSENIAASEEVLQTNDLLQATLQANHSYHFDHLELSGGYQLRQWDFDIYYAGRSGSKTDIYVAQDNETEEHSAFLQALWKPNRQLRLETGLRWSNYSGAIDRFWEPRIHFSYIPLPHLTLHAHAGWYHQVLSQKHLFTNLQAENGFWYVSDEFNSNYIPVVHNRQYSAGLRYQWKGWGVNIEVYVKKIQDIWSSVLDFDVYDDPYKFGDIDIKGLEFSLQYDSKRYSLLWSYDYIKERMKLWDDSQLSSPFMQPHRISLYQGMKWKRLELSLHWKFASGRLFSVPSQLNKITEDDGTVYYALSFDQLLTEQVSDYHSLDLGLRYQIGRPNGQLHGRIGLSANNLYNRTNILENQYYVSYRTDPVSAAVLARRGLPFTPNLSVELFFGG